MKKSEQVVGFKFETKKCGTAEIIEILDSRWRIVKFDDGFTKRVNKSSIRDREVKNPNFPALFGKGILGEGFKCSEGGIITKEYSHWSQMMARCYGGEFAQEHFPSYSNATVESHWYRFQNFAEWCQTQSGFEFNGWHLDKDLLSDGDSLEYNRDVCIFLPREINSALPSLRDAKGVNITKRGTYSVSYFDINKSRRTSKNFKYEDEALEFFKVNRFNKLKLELDKYQSYLDSRATDKLEEIISN